MISKRLIKAIVISVLTSGLLACGEDVEVVEKPLVTWGGKITEQSDRFILSYDEKMFPEKQIDRVEQWWIEVQACAGVSIDISHDGLIIEYRPRSEMPIGPKGKYDGKIEIYDQFMAVIEADLRLDRVVHGQVTKHEMVHYIVYLTGGQMRDNEDHVSPWFGDCSGLPGSPVNRV